MSTTVKENIEEPQECPETTISLIMSEALRQHLEEMTRSLQESRDLVLEDQERAHQLWLQYLDSTKMQTRAAVDKASERVKAFWTAKAGPNEKKKGKAVKKGKKGKK